jgi:hypothetical protein
LPVVFFNQIASHIGIPSDPDRRNKVDMEPMKNMLIKFVKAHFPGVEPKPAIEEVCMYTVGS